MFAYIPTLRPASRCTLPAGIRMGIMSSFRATAISTGRTCRGRVTLYGVITCDRILTDDEMRRFDLKLADHFA